MKETTAKAVSDLVRKAKARTDFVRFSPEVDTQLINWDWERYSDYFKLHFVIDVSNGQRQLMQHVWFDTK